jgi:hypothetical protein
MTVYRVVCVQKKRDQSGHKHIVSVGLSRSTHKDVPDESMTVADVRANIDRGHIFLTIGPHSGQMALVEKDTCPNCPFPVIRSHADHTADNNLASLTKC